MSALVQELLAQAAADAAEGRDLNVAEKGGGGGRLLPEGYAFGRLVEYVEFGNQPQEFNGKAKDPALEFSLGFALTGQGYQNEDGTPYVLRTFNISLTLFEKSRAYKLFKALNWKGTATNFAMLLNEIFLVKIVHVPKSKSDATPVSRIDLDGFLPPLDPVTRTPYAVAEAPDDLFRLFLWNRPTKAAWDSLHIEGTNDAGKSRNYIQETILAALDFQGSPLQLLLAGGVAALPTAAAAPAPLAVPTTVAAPAQAAPSVAVAPAVTVPNVTASVAVAAPTPIATPTVAPATPAVVAPAVAAAPVATSPVLPA